MFDAAEPSTVDGTRRMQTVAMILDCAIVESAELRLPLLVFLLRKARLELEKAEGALAGGTERFP
jgi:hypothetical protein